MKTRTISFRLLLQEGYMLEMFLKSKGFDSIGHFAKLLHEAAIKDFEFAEELVKKVSGMKNATKE